MEAGIATEWSDRTTSRECQRASGSQPTAGRLVGDSRLACRYVVRVPVRSTAPAARRATDYLHAPKVKLAIDL